MTQTELQERRELLQLYTAGTISKTKMKRLGVLQQKFVQHARQKGKQVNQLWPS